MFVSSLKRFVLATAVAAATVASLPAHAGYSGIVFFGDSLSDSGNNFLLLDATNPAGVPQPPITPNAAIASNGFIPSLPYAGAPIPVYSNGPVWASLFAQQMGLASSALPSLSGLGMNFAFGGARIGGTTGFPFSLTDQVGQFLFGTDGMAPSSDLYVVAGGGNDARDALVAIASGQTTIAAAALAYANNVGNIVDQLQFSGATDLVVWNAPNIGAAPAVLAQGQGASFLGTAITTAMNAALALRLAAETDVQIFDLFGTLNEIVANPAAAGLANVVDACIGGNCLSNEFLFWDGIHPTARGHQLLAQAMYAQVVPEPDTYLLFAAGLAILAWSSRQRAA